MSRYPRNINNMIINDSKKTFTMESYKEALKEYSLYICNGKKEEKVIITKAPSDSAVISEAYKRVLIGYFGESEGVLDSKWMEYAKLRYSSIWEALCNGNKDVLNGYQSMEDFQRGMLTIISKTSEITSTEDFIVTRITQGDREVFSL